MHGARAAARALGGAQLGALPLPQQRTVGDQLDAVRHLLWECVLKAGAHIVLHIFGPGQRLARCLGCCKIHVRAVAELQQEACLLRLVGGCPKVPTLQPGAAVPVAAKPVSSGARASGRAPLLPPQLPG